MERYLCWATDHLSTISLNELVSWDQKMRDLEAKLARVEAARDEAVRDRDIAQGYLKQLSTHLEQMGSSVFASSFDSGALAVASLSHPIEQLNRVVYSLRTTFKKHEREKAAVVLALRLSTSRELALRIDIVKKDTELFDLRAKLTSLEKAVQG